MRLTANRKLVRPAAAAAAACLAVILSAGCAETTYDYRITIEGDTPQELALQLAVFDDRGRFHTGSADTWPHAPFVNDLPEGEYSLFVDFKPAEDAFGGSKRALREDHLCNGTLVVGPAAVARVTVRVDRDPLRCSVSDP